tara:strand:+ start:311 stop:1609 length:1299 start_codon:yes stop_codon:yes gene_type:complete
VNNYKKVNVLIIGSGGREHAIAWKIKESVLLNNLYVAPGNSGTHKLAKNVDIDTSNFDELKECIIKNQIDLLIIGPEGPLVAGMHDDLVADSDLKNLKIIGPKKEGSKLEGSKFFAKKFMKKFKIPTADFKSFNAENISEVKNYLESIEPPFVIKADGLAAGKGVFICDQIKEATQIIDDIIINSKFGIAGNKIVIEKFLDGIELSVFILTDGASYKILPVAKDYKRIGEQDTGLNTGGMGAVSPVPFADSKFMQKVKSQIIEPTIKGLQKEHIEYSGFIFFGLINVDGDPFVIEYNVRLGDPETQVVMPRISSDLLALLLSVSSPKLFSKAKLSISSKAASTVIITSGGYPEKYKTGYVVGGMCEVEDSILFHAGLQLENGNHLTTGGRVLAITSCGKTIQNALTKSYFNAHKIQFENMYFRKDIGQDVIK